VSVETIVSQLLGAQAKQKFVAMTIQAWGIDLVRPGDQSFELRRVEAIRSDLLRLTFALNPQLDAGPDGPQLVTISVRDPKSLKLSAGELEIGAATSVRLDERTLTASHGKVRSTEGGEPDGSGEARGPALLLA
jgi:hypothetical protein